MPEGERLGSLSAVYGVLVDVPPLQDAHQHLAVSPAHPDNLPLVPWEGRQRQA